MGTSPSKDADETVTNGNASRKGPSTADGHGPYESSLDKTVRAKKTSHGRTSRHANNDVSTPRTNPASHSAQNRVDSQLAATSENRDDLPVPNMRHINDDQVHVNLAMADLMAYLQVVANNSNDLPLTRRDDPELGKMVSSLTAEEYARKSAAFVPADVRVIGGNFTKYGRVWDLPTSDEYNASDGAQEPGRSYGGACTNAMLKVLYDASNDHADATQDVTSSEALFNDDDDEEEADGPDATGAVELNRQSTYASLDLNDPSNPSTITWADLLRKMKAEMREIEYAQAPTITTTRKMDLNQPFSLIPESFSPATGKKRALLIGCNYRNIPGSELKASHDDVRSMKDYIVNVHGFKEDADLMTVLIDDEHHKHPTHWNITEAFKRLSEESQPGDAVFVQFTGHGGRVLDAPIDAEAESYDEVIVPSDYATSGLIRDTLIFKTLLAPMRYGVTVTILIDCCDTGMMLDLPYAWSTRNDRLDAVAKMTHNDDFSFVRFLKVVKTLYESSTFTQLGKTVGSALNHQPLQMFDDDDHDDVDDDEHHRHDRGGSRMNGKHVSRAVAGSGRSQSAPVVDIVSEEKKLDDQTQSTLIDVLAACASPPQSSARRSKASKDLQSIDTRDTRAPSSLLEQVMNCTYAHAEDQYSDDETYQTKEDRSFCSQNLEESTTYDSATDDGYDSLRSRRGRSRRRRGHV